MWLIFLGIGGGLLALYYIRIGYLPDMEWNAAMIYLFVCSVWGGMIGLLLTISLYLPGVIWSELIVFETTLDNHLTYRALHDEPSGKRSIRKEPCIRGIMIWLGIPFATALIFSHLLLVTSQEDIKPIDFFYPIVAGLLLAETFLVMRWIFRRLLKLQEQCSDEEKKTISRQIFRYAIWFTLSVLLNQFAMYVIYRLADRTPGWVNFLVLTGICSAFVWLSTLVVATRHRYYPRQALVAALVAAVVLLFTADRFSDLSMKLMSRYGVGELKNKKYNLLLTEEGATDVNNLGLCKSDSDCPSKTLKSVEILSKVGDHYFLKADDGSYITLPKKDVIAIRRLEIVEGAKN